MPRAAHRSAGLLAAGGRYPGRQPKIENAAALTRLQEAFQTTLSPIADAHYCSTASVALAWLLAQRGVTAAIAGASSIGQLDTHVETISIELTDAEVAELSMAFADLNWPVAWQEAQGTIKRWLRHARRVAGRTLRGAGIDPRKSLEWTRRLCR